MRPLILHACNLCKTINASQMSVKIFISFAYTFSHHSLNSVAVKRVAAKAECRPLTHNLLYLSAERRRHAEPYPTSRGTRRHRTQRTERLTTGASFTELSCGPRLTHVERRSLRRCHHLTARWERNRSGRTATLAFHGYSSSCCNGHF